MKWQRELCGCLREFLYYYLKSTRIPILPKCSRPQAKVEVSSVHFMRPTWHQNLIKGILKRKQNTGEPHYKCGSSGSSRAEPRGSHGGWPGTSPWVRLNELDPEGIQPNTLFTGKLTTQINTWATGWFKFQWKGKDYWLLNPDWNIIEVINSQDMEAT